MVTRFHLFLIRSNSIYSIKALISVRCCVVILSVQCYFLLANQILLGKAVDGNTALANPCLFYWPGV